MNKFLLSIALAGLLASHAMAANTANITVNVSTSAINELAITGGPITLVAGAAVAGAPPTSVSDATATYAITINQTGHITALIATPMPVGLTLNLTAASTLGTSSGPIALSAVAQTIVSAIAPGNESGKTLTFQLVATSAAGVVVSVAKVVTLTIVVP